MSASILYDMIACLSDFLVGDDIGLLYMHISRWYIITLKLEFQDPEVYQWKT